MSANGASTTPIYTLAEGCPYADPTTAQRFSDGTPVKGLMLLQDTQLIETLAHFSRERIPERVVHARAVGAWGEFEVTHDISNLTDAKFLNGIGTRTKALMRISTVGPGAGAADTLRDVRGWALKFFTEEGNQDFVFNDIPVFFIRDPIKFPSLNRSHKRHPATNITDSTMFWDYHNGNPEGTHALMMLFSGRGTPKSVRHVNGYSGHTYKLTKDDGSFVYVKYHFKSDQGNDTLADADAIRLAGQDPDNHTADLWNSIDSGNFPSWTSYLQVMTAEQAETYRWNIFDMTKVWPHADFPLLPFGKLTLNKNPSNYFADIEQAAFSPSNMVPGVAPSADPVLQARMFAYPDAARYRLGVNYQQLPCNRSICPVYNPYQRDGHMNITANYGGDPNYVGSSLKRLRTHGSVGSQGYAAGDHQQWAAGAVASYSSEVTDEDFVQPREFWNMLGKQPGEQEQLVANIAAHLGSANPALHRGALVTVNSGVFLNLVAAPSESTEAIAGSKSSSFSICMRCPQRSEAGHKAVACVNYRQQGKKDRLYDLADISGLEKSRIAKDAIDRLVMRPETNKDTIKAIVRTYTDSRSQAELFSADFVRGKGEDQIFLLHGPPETGKTLIAAHEKTTSRVGHFDEAFLSRIHVSIGYDPLDDSAREQIWNNLFQKLKDDYKHGGPEIRYEYDAKEYVRKNEVLRTLKWNGREIRNGMSFQTAVALAIHESKVLRDKGTPHEDSIPEVKESHLRPVVTMSVAFKNYIKSINLNMEDSDMAFKLGNRDDKFKGGPVT